MLDIQTTRTLMRTYSQLSALGQAPQAWRTHLCELLGEHYRADEVMCRELRGGEMLTLPKGERIVSLQRVHALSVVSHISVHRTLPFSSEDHTFLVLLHETLVAAWQGRISMEMMALSPRLRQTLLALLEGKREREIAADFGLSAHTVHDYVKQIYRRFDVTTRLELASKVRVTAA